MGGPLEHIEFEGRQIAQGESFEPLPGYTVTFVRTEGLRLILRDGSGEFARPITHAAPRPPRKLVLGERRTLIEEAPDTQPSADGMTVYVLTHQVCVPGSWERVKSTRCRAAAGQAGIWTNTAGIEDDALRTVAEKLWTGSNSLIDQRPDTKLHLLAMHVGLQEDTGKPGGWDDPAAAMLMVDLMKEAGAV